MHRLLFFRQAQRRNAGTGLIPDDSDRTEKRASTASFSVLHSIIHPFEHPQRAAKKICLSCIVVLPIRQAACILRLAETNFLSLPFRRFSSGWTIHVKMHKFQLAFHAKRQKNGKALVSCGIFRYNDHVGNTAKNRLTALCSAVCVKITKEVVFDV